MRYLKNLKAKDLKNRVCLLRLDFNTEDNWRLLASLPTLKFLTNNCRATVILSHKGRPDGFQKSLSLKPLIKDLRQLLKKPAAFLPHFRFLEIKELISASPAKSVFLLENLRFLKEEEENNRVLAEHLATLGDFYVNDAFAVSHRTNASVTAITEFLPSYAGLEMEAEIKNLSKAMKKPKRPLVVILGGLKIENKLKVYENLKKAADSFLIGGALTPAILKKIKRPKILAPVDFKKDNKEVIRDIGPKTAEFFNEKIRTAGTILWNGPLGNILDKRFQNGTKSVAKSVAANRAAYTVAGGGETVMFLKKMKLDKKIDFISTGGGAMLDFLAGKKLPGIIALQDNSKKL